MTTEHALRAAIAANPEDDAPRLAYADWLAQQKNPRGEFIRIQVELARMATDDPAYQKRSARAQSLLKKHRRTWRDEYPKWARSDYPDFQRGFPDEISCTLGDWLRGATALLQRLPVRRVNLRATAKNLARLASSAELLRIRLLDLSHSPLDDASILLQVHADQQSAIRTHQVRKPR